MLPFLLTYMNIQHFFSSNSVLSVRDNAQQGVHYQDLMASAEVISCKSPSSLTDSQCHYGLLDSYKLNSNAVFTLQATMQQHGQHDHVVAV